MEPVLQYAVVGVAVLVVLATSLFKKLEWTSKTKHVVASVLAVVGGTLTVVVGGNVDVENVFTTVLAVHGASQAIYAFLFKGSTVEAKLAQVGSSMEGY